MRCSWSIWRRIGPEGFAAKSRDWNAVAALEDWRAAWARDSNHALERCGLEARIDHRTLEAQREEALERSVQARERGDEAEALRETVRALELDRRPLPQLSPGAWQLKERGIEVAAVQLWREVKAQALEVARVAERLSGQAREWLRRTMERLAPGHELAHAGGRQRREQRELPDRGLDRSAGQDLAAQLRAAYEARQERGERELGEGRVPESARSLAERLREAARSIDPAAAAERAASLQQERLAEERQRALEAERERERVRERERRGHDRGWDHDYGI